MKKVVVNLLIVANMLILVASVGAGAQTDEFTYTLPWLQNTLRKAPAHSLYDAEAFYAGVRRLIFLDKDFTYWEGRFRVPKYLLWSVAMIESAGHWHLRSPGGGAVGLMQCMPGTHRLMKRRYGTRSYSESGAAYFGEQYYTFKCNRLRAWAAYNGGPARGKRFPHRLPWETRKYVQYCEWVYRELCRNGPAIEQEAMKFALVKIVNGDTWTELSRRTGKSIAYLKKTNPYMKIFGLKANDWIAFRVYP